MRIKFSRHIAFFIVFINFILLYFTWRLFQVLVPPNTAFFEEIVPSTKASTRHISKLVTLVINDFELQDNDVSATTHSFIKVFPHIQVIILTKGPLYPPLQFNYLNETFKNIRVVNLSPNFDVPFHNNPLSLIKTHYVLFIPDSTRILHRQSVQQMMNYVYKEPNVIVAMPYSQSRNLSCLNVNLTLYEWKLQFHPAKDLCDFAYGKHAILVQLSMLYKLNNPFLLPFSNALYLQTSHFNYKIRILQGVQFQDGKPLFHSHHAQRQKLKSEQQKLRTLYETYSIKQVIRENGAVEYYGCTRETPRCFGTVINYTPSYVYANKTTPPCCLENLRKTARHVFNILQEAGIRFWLDGGSLIGAMRSGDVIPWDYDVDVSFNRDDLSRCIWLRKAKNKPTVDTKGFLWEKATEGNFYRVHFSRANRIFVNLFPFFAKNGTMTKDSWYTGHKSMEFPDHFLHPMSSIEFIGRLVPSPNNIRDYLELKYEKGIIENVLYPDFKYRFT